MELKLLGVRLMRTILLADDSVSMRFKQRDILIRCGYVIVGEAETVEEAVEKYKELIPDIVIAGLNLSSFDGVQIVKSIRAIDENALIIICSALGAQREVIEVIQNGAKDYVMIPFQEERLLEAVKRVADCIDIVG
jgi:two-component system chemotaxis response regulator CheY